jgi:cytidylate kinase
MEGGVFQIAIDGPSGAGKSTIAKAVAARLSMEYIDTGAMYRAVAYKMLEEGIGTGGGDAARLRAMLACTDVDFSGGRICLDGRDVSGEIRNSEIAEMASACSALPAVREKLVALQREMGKKKSVVMDGRDIGSNVFPDARFKFYLTAAPEERAHRRHLELLEKGEGVTPEKVLADIMKRDHDDSHRKLNPLTKTADAMEIDSTEMCASEVTDVILKKIRGT